MPANQFTNETTSLETEALLVHNPEFDADMEVAYKGRIDFGTGNIDASSVQPEEFNRQLEHIASEGLYYEPDVLRRFGSCMDGRGNVATLTGNKVIPRPKLIGGPSLFAYYIAAIARFSAIQGEKDPLAQFALMNKLLKKAGIMGGMHVSCGAAMGAEPVVQNYGNNFDEIDGLNSDDVSLILDSNDTYRPELLEGLDRTAVELSSAKDFTEPKMHEIVKSLWGPEAIIHLREDLEHEAQGHHEVGLVRLKVENGVGYKDKVIENTGLQVFFQNDAYARKIIKAIARTDEELEKGIIVADQLPVAGVATLGKNQHVGEIVGSLA